LYAIIKKMADRSARRDSSITIKGRKTMASTMIPTIKATQAIK
jgi:hypothetical protein